MRIIYELILICISAYVYSDILTRSEMILDKFDTWAYDKLPAWIYKPLIGCPYCVAGQWSFWFYLISYFHEYNIFTHIAFTFSSIYFISFIKWIHQLTDKN